MQFNLKAGGLSPPDLELEGSIPLSLPALTLLCFVNCVT